MKLFGTLAAVVGLLISSIDATAATLSPASWPEAERLRLEAREAALWPTAIRTMAGDRGMVSATASPIAVHAGVQAMREGGTAADAAVATALAQVVMMAGANVSFAGVAELLYFDARTHRVYVLDAGWNSWRGEHDPRSIPGSDISVITGQLPAGSGQAGRKTLVPGFMAGMGAMHRRFGRLPWRRLFDPALHYAKQGVPVTPMLAAYFNYARPVLQTSAEDRAFLSPGGAHLPELGERFVVPGLAATLRSVARGGPRVMYTGPWAHHFVKRVRAQGGAATMADMAAYRPRWTEPLTMDFAGGTIIGPDSSNPSGCAISMALNLIGHMQVKGRYWDNGSAFRATSLALRVATTAPFSQEVAAFEKAQGIVGDCRSRLSPAYGAAAAGIDRLAGGAPPPAGHHSASVVAVDRWGNVAALVHSSNTVMWGDSGMIVDGVPIPTPAGLYQQRLATIAPGERVPSDMAPVMMMRDGKLRFALAVIGTSLVQETVRLTFGLSGDADIAEWLGAPPLLLNLTHLDQPPAAREELIPAARYRPDLIAGMSATGFILREVDAQRTLTLRGTAAVVRLNVGGRREAAEVPGLISFAEGTD